MELAALLTSFITPFLPHLLKLGQPAAEAAGKKLGEKFGEDSWEKAKQVWGKLAPRVKEKPMAQGAAAAIAEDTRNERAKDLLVEELKELLAADVELKSFLQQLLNENAEAVASVTQVTQTVTGDRNIVIGNASGSTNITQN